jgi:hypothetical protein
MDRSVPDLEIFGRSSLMSILRWSYKTNMDKTMTSSNGQISLVIFSSVIILFFPYISYRVRAPLIQSYIERSV